MLLSNDDLTYISNKDSLLNLNTDLKEFLEDSRETPESKIKNNKKAYNYFRHCFYPATFNYRVLHSKKNKNSRISFP